MIEEPRSSAVAGASLSENSPEYRRGPPPPEAEIRPLYLVMLLLVLLALVGLLLWIVPQTIGAGVVNVTVRS